MINNGQIKAAIVTDEEGRLLGLVADGDIRRAFLRGVEMHEPVAYIMNRTPTTLSVGYSPQQAEKLFKNSHIFQIPVIDSENRVVGVEIPGGTIAEKRIENPVVIMAGGLGKRLLPFTQFIPKPMVSICGTPLLEIMLTNLKSLGFYKFYISVKYKKDVIKDYFSDGAKIGISIAYIEEEHPLGTAGALSLIPERPSLPFLVVNGDILTNVNFRQLLTFHEQHQAVATMSVYKFGYQIPYGVVKYEDGLLKEITEKPTETFFVNSGIYCLSPEALDILKPDQPINMTDIFTHFSQKNSNNTVVYPIHEYWQDIGHSGDLEKAQQDYPKHFVRL